MQKLATVDPGLDAEQVLCVLEACERVASTLQLRSATGLPIAAVVAQQDRWQSEVTLLDLGQELLRIGPDDFCA